MPELPDVQIFKEYLDATALHQRVAEVLACQGSLLEDISCPALARRLTGNALTVTARHGKNLFARIGDGGYLVMHFGMTGFLRYFKDRDKSPEHTRLLLRLHNGYFLAYVCQRKLGRIGLADSLEDYAEKKQLGPDALELSRDPDAFVGRLQGHRGALKGLLMNQKVIAGFGNIYTDEVLFQAGLHPKRSAGELSDPQRRSLAATGRHVLETAIEHRVGEKGWPGNWLLPKRRKGQKCPRCGRAIERITVSGRAGYYCPGHQR